MFNLSIVTGISMKVKVKRRIFIVVIIGISVASMSALKNMRPEPKKKPKIETTMLVETIDLKSSNVTFEIQSQGTVKPRTETVLSAEVSGRIISISDKFIAGAIFQKNEVLMQIDPTNYQVAVDQADALLKQREIEFNGAKSLRNKGYRAEAELAVAKSALTAAKAALVIANKNLDRTHIRLPYDGLVKSKNSDVGQFVNLGTHLGTTFAINSAEIRLALTDQELAFLDLPEAGDIVEKGSFNGSNVKLSAIRKGQYQTWNAHIVRTEGVVDEKSRVTYAVARIDDPYRLSLNSADRINDNALPIGTFVKAAISGRSFLNVIKVPRSSIRGKNELMFIDTDNRLRIKTVDILRSDSDFAYIQEGALSGDRITITAIESPIDGMKVRTSEEIPTDEKLAVKRKNEDKTNDSTEEKTTLVKSN